MKKIKEKRTALTLVICITVLLAFAVTGWIYFKNKTTTNVDCNDVANLTPEEDYKCYPQCYFTTEDGDHVKDIECDPGN